MTNSRRSAKGLVPPFPQPFQRYHTSSVTCSTDSHIEIPGLEPLEEDHGDGLEFNGTAGDHDQIRVIWDGDILMATIVYLRARKKRSQLLGVMVDFLWMMKMSIPATSRQGLPEWIVGVSSGCNLVLT